MKNNLSKYVIVLTLLTLISSCLFQPKTFNYGLNKGNVFIKEITTDKNKTFKTVVLKDKVKFYEARVPIWFTDIYQPLDTIK